MMEIKDLKIGNWYSNGQGEYLMDEMALIDALEFHQEFNDVLYDPIPLSEEWLLRFGFEEHSIVFNHPKFNYTIDYSRKGGAYIDDIDLSLKFVHQLQNLYFCLTGEELKTKQ